ncbi:MAG TPA: hypothetical protein VGH68_05045 [Paraburkholderia sp.]
MPQFVGKQKRDDQQRNDEKNPEYHVLVHDSLQSQEIDFIVEHRLFPRRAAPLVNARPAVRCGKASRWTRLPERPGRGCGEALPLSCAFWQ